jgi:hypothetical protein
MYPHERSLVASLQGKPFVFLGVNSDDDREQLRRAVAAKGITWRSWGDGGTDGPIARRWQVETWPTLFVLDGKGVVRYRVSNLAQVEQAVDTLLREFGRSG